MRIRPSAIALSAAFLAALLTSCSSAAVRTSAASAPARPPVAASGSAAASPSTTAAQSTTAAPAAQSTATAVVFPTTPAAPGTPVQQVRDAFAELQATYTDAGCADPGNCGYFVNRLLENLDDLYASMKASPEGPGHFEQPLAWIGRMRTSLGGDLSLANVEKHQSLLRGTRDQINTWMQAHPQDYR
ncbi:hypothetical protein [Streptacidiphilus sp. P02-A3a]|uniref:hypothetical protein n=1 Tax=Streptacidiphilus sp. P02-A3a TaxID=2704468 RepID=UPI0015FB748B|nr:hypothetical protein [Streptacidiphilus sp. P02-A3a]QMU70216.1 hypothetical protein GXP74_20350 [Streptacidiphilus sp. P02-A3a]QMU70328.1 hypothetical protein GXP74_21025 [Streptacidiphilus sp. P02-A3a]